MKKSLKEKLRTLLSKFKKSNYVFKKNLDPADYEKWYYNRPEAKQYLKDQKIWRNLCEIIESYKPEKVFEFGSGLGNLLKECEKKKINIIGSETSNYAIRNSKSKRIIKIGEIPRSNLPFQDSSFDLVVSSEVMEHIKEEYTVSVIRELSRICSANACLTINTFGPNQPGHINMHPREWWLNVFETNGFSIDERKWWEVEQMKYLRWDVYCFKKTNGVKKQ